MGKLRTRVGLGAAVVGIGILMGAPAFADEGRFQITSPESGSRISSTPTIKGIGTPGDKVAVDAVNQQKNEVKGACHTTVASNGRWSCTITPELRPGKYRAVAYEIPPGSTKGADDNDVDEVTNLVVPGGELPITGGDPLQLAAGGLVFLTGGALVVTATRKRHRARHAF